MTEKDAVKCEGAGWVDAAWVEVAPVVDTAAAAGLLEMIARHAVGKQGTES